MDTQKIYLMMQVIEKRFKERSNFISKFELSYDSQNQDGKWFCEIRHGLPESDALIWYKAGGSTLEEAFNLLVENVMYDKPVTGELG